MTGRNILLLIASSAIVIGGFVVSFRAWNMRRLPAEVAAVLRSADTIELLSIQPGIRRGEIDEGDDRPKFHSWPVLGQTELKNGADRERLYDALCAGVASNPGMVAGCFNPRHGIRAEHDGHTTELVICFECMSLQAFHDGQQLESVLITADPQSVFDDILKAAGIELADKAH
jgi:hypothetical protein